MGRYCERYLFLDLINVDDNLQALHQKSDSDIIAEIANKNFDIRGIIGRKR